MNKSRILLGVATLVSVGLPFACGDSAGTGGAGTTSTSAGPSTATTSSHAGVTVTSTTGSGMQDCTGPNDPYMAPCGPCLESSCCNELATAAGDKTNAAVIMCLQTKCPLECDGSPPFTLQCTGLPDPAPSTGSCVALGGKIECNPVTNEGCTGVGEACDIQTGGFTCYATGNDHAVCETCGNGSYCKAGLSCQGNCARYCCSDADCGPGSCVKTLNGNALFASAADLGICGDGTGGAGGSGATSSSSSSSTASSSSASSTSSSGTASSSASSGGSGGMGGSGGASTATGSTTGSTGTM